jgi:hypothetical protein
MPIVDAIAAVHARQDLHEDDRRRQVYALKVDALLDAVQALLGRTITHAGFSFCINDARATEQPALFLDVTFTRPPALPVTHQITIVNPPVLPRVRSGDERKDLIQALHEMLEGFV